MLYKDQKEIFRDMMDNIPDDHEKREGSLIYDAVKPPAIEIGLAYEELEKVHKNLSIDTAAGDVLTELCFQNGTVRQLGETDEQLRERHKDKIITPPQDANTAQYREWALAYEGIGTAKVFPLWNGGNTVKVAITDGMYQVAGSGLVDAFQEYLDPEAQGLGNGVAPIGAKVTVSGGVRKDINITGNVVLTEGFADPEGVAEAVATYLASVTYMKNSVSYMRMAVTILDTPSIADLNSFTLNGGVVDVELIGEDIPTLNNLNLTVVSS